MYTEQQIIDAWYKSTEDSPVGNSSLTLLLRTLKESKQAVTETRLPYVPPIPKRDY